MYDIGAVIALEDANNGLSEKSASETCRRLRVSRRVKSATGASLGQGGGFC